MNSVWRWIVQNEQWVFSGIGLATLAAAGRFIWKLFSKEKVDSAPPSININVSPTISPTFSTNQSRPIQNIISGGGGGNRAARPQPEPDIKALTFKAEFVQRIGTGGRSCFIISFRNDGWADATNVIAHIGYCNELGTQKFLVDYGGWIEPSMNIPRGHTKNLIIAVTEDEKNFAVSDTGPATNYIQSKLVQVGEITPGDWMIQVTLSADNFRREYLFDLKSFPNASLTCHPSESK